MNSYKIFAGPMEEYEIIRTDAPIELVEQQVSLNNSFIGDGEVIQDPYNLIREKGFQIEIIANHIDFENDNEINEFDIFEDNEEQNE